MLTRVVALFFLVFTQICWAQVNEHILKFDYLSIKNGLSHNTIFSLLQDRYGYIWIGTQNGLNRYDGFTCKLYSLDDSIATNQNYSGEQVSALFEDKKGNNTRVPPYSDDDSNNDELLGKFRKLQHEYTNAFTERKFTMNQITTNNFVDLEEKVIAMEQKLKDRGLLDPKETYHIKQ